MLQKLVNESVHVQMRVGYILKEEKEKCSNRCKKTQLKKKMGLRGKRVHENFYS